MLPAINIGLSVSRVGSAAQVLAMKRIAGSLKLELAQYREIKDFMKFGSDLDESTLNLIKKGKLLTLLLLQDKFSPYSVEEQILLLYAGLNDHLNQIATNKELKIFFKNLILLIENSFMFSVHFNLLRVDEYYEECENEFFEIILNYI